MTPLEEWSERVDKILAGGPPARMPDRCWRCDVGERSHTITNVGLCERCLLYLQERSDDDPVAIRTIDPRAPYSPDAVLYRQEYPS